MVMLKNDYYKTNKGKFLYTKGTQGNVLNYNPNSEEYTVKMKNIYGQPSEIIIPSSELIIKESKKLISDLLTEWNMNDLPEIE